ncbi:hypothetical protein [Actinacidiphila soli]|nr:hypothetical protein [Actinacidiphila soli]
MFLTFVATPTLFLKGWSHGGVKLVYSPKPRSTHRVHATDVR